MITLRIASLFIPFLGLILLWFSPRRLGRKVIYTLGLVLYGILYLGLVVLLLLRFGGAKMEWRGGYVPVLTWNKTHTDLAALERSRAAQQKSAAPVLPRTFPPPYWTGFRGPKRDGIYAEASILTDWPTNGLRMLWKQPCGGGYASFSIAEGLAFTIEQRRELEVAVAYDVETGREIWTNAWPARFSEMHSDDGPRTTPEYDNGWVYFLGAMGELRCLNATNGAIIWHKNIVEDCHGGVPQYGISATPLLVGDRLIVQNYGSTNGSATCLNKTNGAVLWNGGAFTMGYASPALMTNGGECHIILGGRPDVFGLRLEDGVTRWHAPWPILNHERPIAQPLIISPNRVLFSASYATGGTLFEITPSGNGFEAKEVWKSRKIKTRFAAAVYFEGHIYGLDEEILTCLDAATGETKWKDGRYGYGQVLLAGRNLILMSNDGDLALVKASPDQFTELARFNAIHGKTWNIPAIAAGRLIVRNVTEMACFDITPPTQKVSVSP